MRSWWWWLGCRGQNRAEEAGRGMDYQRMVTKASGALAHSGVMLPHSYSGGCTTLGCVNRNEWSGEANVDICIWHG